MHSTILPGEFYYHMLSEFDATFYEVLNSIWQDRLLTVEIGITSF